jgi:hypothetical protein
LPVLSAQRFEIHGSAGIADESFWASVAALGPDTGAFLAFYHNLL